MSVHKDPSGRRSVQIEVVVPGTPEQVWQAIASGPGISSWFVPTKFETNERGEPVRVLSNFGPGMESVATVTSWDAPHTFTADSADLGPTAPTIATEWTVEARGDGTCTVRVVHSLFASGDDWDGQLEGWEGGWPGFFRLLRLYLTRFPGQTGSAFPFMGAYAGTKEEAWAALTRALGFGPIARGERVAASAHLPPLAGVVERAGEAPHAEELLLALDRPAPGIAHFFAMPMGGQVILSVRFYLYGPGAAAVVERDEPRWKAWMAETFPMVGAPLSC